MLWGVNISRVHLGVLAGRAGQKTTQRRQEVTAVPSTRLSNMPARGSPGTSRESTRWSPRYQADLLGVRL